MGILQDKASEYAKAIKKQDFQKCKKKRHKSKGKNAMNWKYQYELVNFFPS